MHSGSRALYHAGIYRSQDWYEESRSFKSLTCMKVAAIKLKDQTTTCASVQNRHGSSVAIGGDESIEFLDCRTNKSLGSLPCLDAWGRKSHNL